MKEIHSTKLILKKLCAFSIPLILSGLLQQLFNWVDALIVGNIIGEAALAGVGATSSLYNLFVTAIAGFTSGLSVLFAQHFGEGNHKANTNLLASYSLLLTFIFLLLSALGMAFTAPVLTLMRTPASLFSYAKNYLLIIFIGIPFLSVYNTYSAALRGLGNSTVPFIAVLLSSVINGIMDYIFIAYFKLGVSGAAAATVISQAAMAAFIVLYTVSKHPELRFPLFKAGKYRNDIKKGAKYGLPPAVQGSVSSVGNLFLQRFMNGFGEHTVSAITAAYRVDSMLLLPIVNFSTAISTLVAQETGAENKEAAKKIFKLGTVVMSFMSLILTAVIVLTGRSLLSMFGLKSESVNIGVSFFRSIAIFYLVYGLSMSIKGYLEGKADMLFSGTVGVCSLAVRILCSYLFKDVFGNMVIAYAEAFSWMFLLAVYFFRYRKKSRL